MRFYQHLNVKLCVSKSPEVMCTCLPSLTFDPSSNNVEGIASSNLFLRCTSVRLLEHYYLLTLAHVDGAEGYCNLVFYLCVCVCVCKHNFWTTNNIATSIELPTDVKLYKDQNKRQAFPKTFGYKVMTIFTAHNCRFILSEDFIHVLSEDFCYQKSMWKHNSTSLKAIAVETLELLTVLQYQASSKLFAMVVAF